MPTTIAEKPNLPTYINVFHCEPDKQRGLADAIRAETEEVVRHLPGFVSSNVHRSTDGRRVTNYAQWTDLTAFIEHITSERGQAMIAEIRKYADDVDICVYEVDWTSSRGD
jgi:quinol monooxygenase YgiN